MAEPYLGEIRLFPFSFAPRGWALCDGQLLEINQNQALYALLGTTYGGDGRTSFGLPDLRGRVAVHQGNGIAWGEAAGETLHALSVQEIPAHVHPMGANHTESTSKDPASHIFGPASNLYATAANATMSPEALSAAGESQPHPNMQPYLVGSYCIALSGIFPPRN